MTDRRVDTRPRPLTPWLLTAGQNLVLPDNLDALMECGWCNKRETRQLIRSMAGPLHPTCTKCGGSVMLRHEHGGLFVPPHLLARAMRELRAA